MNTHPDANMTLREAYERHYLQDDLAENTLNLFRYRLNTWERLTDNPQVGSIDNETLQAFRAAALADGLAPTSVNGIWRVCRAILRRIGPKMTGNPFALGIIPDVPAMRPCKVIHKPPRIISLDDLSRVYIAARNMLKPRTGIPASDWWRGLMAVAFTTGLRKSDLAALKWDQLDLQAGTLTFTAQKTGRGDTFPLHPVAVAHLQRLQHPGSESIFPTLDTASTDRFYAPFKQLQRDAGVQDVFSLHDIRRSAASHLESVAPTMGGVLLQHAHHDVTSLYYVNKIDGLRAALDKLPIPNGWKAGPGVAAKREEQVRQERVKMRQEDFVPLRSCSPDDWAFSPGGFAFKGRWHAMHSGVRQAILRRLATSLIPVQWDELVRVAKEASPSSRMATATRVSIIVCELRNRLRECLGLSPELNPIPLTQRTPPAWQLWIPNT